MGLWASKWCCGAAAAAGAATPLGATGPHMPWLVNATRGRDFTLDGQTCWGKVVDVYDGDTVRVVFRPEGFAVPVQMPARMAGYNSPEMKQSTSEPERERERKRALAVAARTRLAALVLHQVVHVRCGPFDKYGRVLVTLAAGPRSPITINDIMVVEGHGKPYSGHTAKPRH